MSDSKSITKIVLKQHHFKYTDDFAAKISTFALSHLEDNNKQFKAAWKEWVATNTEAVKQEIEHMQQAGYEGSVEDKMYFSARYYYRKKAKKAIAEEKEEEYERDDEKTPRKKYEPLDKNILQQMNEHILSQIRKSITEEGISEMTPSKSFANYCKQFAATEDVVKKNYKNLYWRISKQTAKKTR